MFAYVTCSKAQDIFFFNLLKGPKLLCVKLLTVYPAGTEIWPKM